MKRTVDYTARRFWMMLLTLLWAQPLLAQSVPERRIENKALIRYNHLDGFSRSIESNIVSFLVKETGRLVLQKSVYPAVALPGETVTFTIVAGNTGTASLASVQLVDTLPSAFSLISVNQGEVRGSIISRFWSRCDAGWSDTLLIVARVLPAAIQGTQVINTAYGSDSTGTIVRSSTTMTVGTGPHLEIVKTASSDTVLVGDSIRYVLRFRNSGNVMLRHVLIRDTIPGSMNILAFSRNVQRSGTIITAIIDSLSTGAEDSIWIVVRTRRDLPNRLTIINTAYAESDQTPRTGVHCGIVTKVFVEDKSCIVALRSNPGLIIGNGIQASVIQAFLSDTLGHPKPDGTPVTFSTTKGFFSNGRDNIIVPTKDGFAIDSVRAVIVSSSIDTSYVTVSADDADVCAASNKIMVIFYPGAITGIVHNRQTGLPVENVLVQVYSSTNVLVGSARTGADGRYLIPVPRTDTYRVVIYSTNTFGELTTASMYVPIVVPGTGGNPPTVGNNQLTGSVFYLISNRPVPAAGISILLNPITAGAAAKRTTPSTVRSAAAIDSTVTDSTGAYLFANIRQGTYEVAIAHPWIQGRDTVENIGGGELVIDVNIPVVLNPSLTFIKQGPAHATIGDTAVYTITATNSGTLMMTNTVITDTLDPSMKFVGASGSGTYDPSGHRIIWESGTLPENTQLQHSVRIVFQDTLRAAHTVTNCAAIGCDEIVQVCTDVSTRIYVPSKLQIWKRSSVSSAQPGDTVRYTIIAENTGGARADSIHVRDALPWQVRLLGTTPIAQYDSMMHLLRWSIDSLRPGQQYQMTLTTVVRSDLLPGEHLYNNTAELVWHDGSTTSDADARSQAQVKTLVSYLRVTKQAIRKIVDIGDFAGYVIRVTNVSSSSAARNVVLNDRIPFGFSYADGSSVLDSTRIKDPDGRQLLRWLLADSLPPNTTLTLSYRLVAGAGGMEGNGINTAQAFASTSTGSATVSDVATERVEVRRGVFTDRGVIVGKVFYDDNRNVVQDEGEEGVKNIELMMEDGTRIVTGDDGKYSMPDVPPGRHVIKVRQHTLPEGATLLEGYGAFAGDPSSRFVVLTESNIARADFYLARKLALHDTASARMTCTPPGTVQFQRITEPKNIIFNKDDYIAMRQFPMLQFEEGKAALRQREMDILHDVALVLRDYPDQRLWITAHTDSLPSREFRSNDHLARARAEMVKQYLIDHEGIDSTRIRSVSQGAEKPITPNRTPEGRAFNRRVELLIDGTTDQPQRYASRVLFHIPISYEGSVPLKRMVIHDVLDTLFHYVEGSATLGNQRLTPRMEGRSLYWSVDSIGKSFHATLSYRATLIWSGDTTLSAASRTTMSVALDDSMIVNDHEAGATNTMTVVERGKAINTKLFTISFEDGKADLRPSVVPVLNEAGEILKKEPRTYAVIEGHTDSLPVTKAKYSSNLDLSRARAEHVVDYLVKNFGISRNRLKSSGWGSKRPIAPNSTIEGYRENRRVEIRISVRGMFNESLHDEVKDSSALVRQHILPSSKQPQDTLAIVEPGMELIFKMQSFKRAGSTTAVVMIDSLHPSLAMVPNSVMTIGKVDSVQSQQTVLKLYSSSQDSSCTVIYRVRVLPTMQAVTEFQHSATILNIQSDGTSVFTRSTPITIRIRTK